MTLSTGSTFLTSMRTLSLKNIQSYDAGQYTCTGESGDRSSEDSGNIIIKGKTPSVKIQIIGGKVCLR